MNLLDKQLVIKLNKNWIPFELITVKQAFTFLCSEANGVKPGFAIDFEVVTDSDGKEILGDNVQTLTMEDWINLPIRENDLYVGVGWDPLTQQPKKVRVPLVVICSNYKDLSRKSVKWSPTAVRQRDRGICQVSKRKLEPHEGDTGHWVAKARGGKNTFENTIYMDKALNRIQGTRTPEEMGWKIPKPKAPMGTVKVLTLDDMKHPAQRPFLI